MGVPGRFALIDNPPHQPRSRKESVSAGDMLVLTAKLLDERNRPAGTEHRTCLATRPGSERNGRAVFQCQITFKLRGGDITGQTTYRDEPGSADIAVTGGTRAYEGANGSVSYGNRKVGKRTLNEARIHLLP